MHTFTCIAAVHVCEKGDEWAQVLELLSGMVSNRVWMVAMTCNASAVCACGQLLSGPRRWSS